MATLIRKKVRTENLYLVGYSPGLKKYVMEITIPYKFYYQDYYEISKEEYNMFGTLKLDQLASSLVFATTSSPRFLCSAKDGGNPEIIKKLFQK